MVLACTLQMRSLAKKGCASQQLTCAKALVEQLFCMNQAFCIIASKNVLAAVFLCRFVLARLVLKIIFNALHTSQNTE